MGSDQSTVLRLKGVSKRFPGVEALKAVDFEVVAGEIHALLGENGAGKSTLMGVASGSIQADEGDIEINGEHVDDLTPLVAHRKGVAIVHQEPALLPDLTVLENMVLGVPRELRDAKGAREVEWASEQLRFVGCNVDLGSPVRDVGVATRQLIELAKAFASRPRILILDEPTAPLGTEHVERLYELVREVAARGTAVVYISHRLPEVRAIADRVTVMRDGAVRGTSLIDDISDDELLELIVGRALEAAFPPKSTQPLDGRGLRVAGLSGDGFENVAMSAVPGEIVGLAGIAGNGQAEFLRALAGLTRATGELRLGNRLLKLGRPVAARNTGIFYVSADRHGEGLLKRLSMRENTALTALPQFAPRGVVQRRKEAAAVQEQRGNLSIRTPSIETEVSTLSGGNQQKVVMARSLLSNPSLLLVDEPTQGVDAGARVEIYRILRQIANDGIPVVVLSSDGLELEGLCDRVYIFSRGHVVAELNGEEVTEREIAQRMVTATTHRRRDARDDRADVSRGRVRLRQFIRGDRFPSVVLLAAMIVLALYTYSVNDRVLSAFNIGSALTLLAALALISLGQATVIFTGGIDISAGPLAGLVVVVASFFIVADASGLTIALGLMLMLVVAAAVGLTNGSLVRFGRFTPVAATLATFIALRGVSLLLRPTREGTILRQVADVIQVRVGPIPVAFIVVVLLAVTMEYLLRRSRAGLSLRAVGSNDKAAHRLGVPVSLTIVGAYVVCSLFVFLGGVMLMAQIGVGDPVAGIEYTLWSIAAVVLGGASLFGGRGSYVGTLLGAALIQQVLNSTVFLNLSQEWQFWLLGLLTLAAAGVYSQARRVKEGA